MHAGPAIASIAATIVVAAIAACDGSLREKLGQSDIDASLLMSIPRPPCEAPVTAPDSGVCAGGGQPGSDCLMCHHQGGGASPYTFAGTLYDAAGTAAVTGATIRLQDGAGNVATAITRPNGNFFTSDGFVQYPARAFVSRCPDVIEMLGVVDATTGANCNTSGCHTAGFQVHLP